MSKNKNLYGSALGNSNIRATNAYGWGFQFRKNSLPNFIISNFGVFHIGARIRAKILLEIINDEDYSQSSLFDAGCGMGLNSFFLADRFKSVFGVDLDKEKIEQAKILSRDNHLKNIDFKVADLLVNNFTKSKFDVTVCFEVIEHVKDYKILIKTLSKHIKRNGKIILSFPSNSLISAWAQKSLQHERVGFLPSDIKSEAKKNNLKIAKEYSFGNTIVGQGIIALDFFIKQIIPEISPILFLFFYPFIVIDAYLPKMGIPRGYVLVLESAK